MTSHFKKKISLLFLPHDYPKLEFELKVSELFEIYKSYPPPKIGPQFLLEYISSLLLSLLVEVCLVLVSNEKRKDWHGFLQTYTLLEFPLQWSKSSKSSISFFAFYKYKRVGPLLSHLE